MAEEKFAFKREDIVRIASGLVKKVDPSINRTDAALLAEYLAYTKTSGASEVPPDTSMPARRWQDSVIEREIPVGASVLDLGCGGGELLAKLMTLKGARVQGVELDAEAVIECVGRGVPVLQADLDEGLKGFPDNSFDYIVLEETLQTLHRPLTVLDEMLRVGKEGIVSFPNFAYWRIRLSLAIEGRMPVTERLPYRWYNTPNIHLFTLQDFLDWTADNHVHVVKSFAYADDEVRPIQEEDNLFAEEALFFVTRRIHSKA